MQLPCGKVTILIRQCLISMCLCVCLSVCLCVCLSVVCLSVCLSALVFIQIFDYHSIGCLSLLIILINDIIHAGLQV